MTRRFPPFACLLSLALAGCASQGAAPPPPVVFVVLRHAEKAADDPKDPALSEAGRARAERVADALADAPLRAAYATAYRRTQATAAPAAARRGLAVSTYDASMPAAGFAAELRRAHPEGTVLIVGHSNTAPAIAAALCACPVAPMREDEFDRWMEIRIGPDGVATLRERRY